MSDTPVKPRSRLGLYVPVFGFLAVLLGFCLLWAFEASQFARVFDAQIADLSRRGLTVAHGPVAVSGFPFRLYVDLGRVTISDPRGRVLTLPQVSAEALTLSPGDWVIDGGKALSLQDPYGRTDLTASAVRMSLRGLLDPDRLRTVTEIREARFTTTPQSLLSSAKLMAFYTRPHGDPKGADPAAVGASLDMDILFKLDEARLVVRGPLSDLAGRGVSVQWEGRVPSSLDRVLEVKGEVHAGALKVYSETPELTFDAQGRPEAEVQIDSPDAEPIYSGFGLSGLGGPLKAKVRLKDGKAKLSKFDLDLGL